MPFYINLSKLMASGITFMDYWGDYAFKGQERKIESFDN